MRRTLANLVGATIFLVGCATTGPENSTAHGDTELNQVVQMMTGWFDSRAQAAEAPDDFFEIRLVMLPIWPEREDGRWLYVEQAAYSALDRPYRQRVYHVHRTADGTIISDVYTLPGDPKLFTGSWSNPALFADLSPNQLDMRIGCSILLERTGSDLFEGGTIGEGCASTLAGAAYATSIVSIRPEVLVSWDQGWDAQGEQVWGAEKRGYEFIKYGDGPPTDP